MPASDFTDEHLLEAIFKNLDPAPDLQLANVWVALFTAAPNKAGGGTEVSGNAYVRLQTDINDWSVSGSPNVAQNINPLLFPAATPAGWGTIVAAGLFDAATVGNLLFFDTLAVPLVVDLNDQFAFGNGALTFTGA